MATRLSKISVGRAIDHLVKFGDTDIFPHLVELVFLQECKDKIVDEVASLDLDTFSPSQSLETIAPKSRYGFRIVNQMFPLETLLFTASAIEIGGDLEKLKIPLNESNGPFAYRFSGANEPTLFEGGKSYRDWLEYQSKTLDTWKYDAVVFADIADYYHRINFHRLENCLDTGTGQKGVKRFIEKVIKTVRSRQSFGIPVGGSASRIIAEAVLSDSDNALIAEGYDFSRFIDDFRVFLKAGQSPYSALAFLAEQLAVGEGLTLNAQKTRVYSIQEFEKYLAEELADALEESGRSAFDALVHSLYFDEEPDPEDVKTLQSLNLQSLLQEEIEKDSWDFGRVKAIFRALRIVQDSSSIDFFIDKADLFMPFVKEFVLYFSAVKPISESSANELKSAVFKQLNGVAASVPVIRAWLLELAVREVISLDSAELNKLPQSEPLDIRQQLLIRGLNRDVNYFRKNKTRFDQVRLFEKMPFILGASCLPKDEYTTWLSAIKSGMDRPLDGLFCEWAKTKHGMLRDVLKARLELSAPSS